MIEKLKTAGITAAVLYAALYAYRVSGLKLKYFKPYEFGVWFPLIDEDTLTKLDQFRDRIGFPVSVSPAPGAVGRISSETSQHFPAPFVKAVDVFPQWPQGGTPQELKRGYEVARDVGFTGIGVYPDTSPRPMMHVDTRDDREPGQPATWARFKTADGGYQDEAITRAFV